MRQLTFRYSPELEFRFIRGKQGLPENLTFCELYQKLDNKWIFINYGCAVKKNGDVEDNKTAIELSLSRCTEFMPEDMQRQIFAELERKEIIKREFQEKK